MLATRLLMSAGGSAPPPFVPDDYSDAVLEDSPVLYLRLGDVDGPMRDGSGNGHDGNVVGTVTRGEPGLLPFADGAARFGGGRVVVPFAAQINPAAFTFEFMFNAPTSGSTGSLVHNFDSANWRGWRIDYDPGPRSITATVGDGTRSRGFVYHPTLNHGPGARNHVAIVDNGMEMQIFANGQAASALGLRVYAANQTADMFIGSRFDGTQPYMAVLDEVAVYDQVLAPSRIAQHAIEAGVLTP